MYSTVKKGDKGVDLLASLCNKYDTSEDELRKTMEKTNDIIADILKKRPCLASECKNENLDNINPGVFEIHIYGCEYFNIGKIFSFYASEILILFDADGLIYYEDLIEESSVQSSLAILEKDYEDAIHSNGELDERVFINEEDSLLGSGSPSGGAINVTGTKVSLCQFHILQVKTVRRLKTSTLTFTQHLNLFVVNI